ncbi:MAG: helix-turn-helix domain-containing protein [Phycisphaeraceae bacterium]|nr:MAG: helix-turn-helix domain-containing protein [Phycisphaeraceae bacterium]
MNQTNNPRFDALRNACDITEAMCRLPAVATLDWLDRAAESLRGVVVPSRVCVLILNAGPSGAGVQLEAAGFAGLPAGGRPTDSDEGNIELSVRSRAERLESLGFQSPERAMLGNLADLLGGGDWRMRGLGVLWHGVPASDVLVAAQPLGAVEPGRLLISQISLAEPGAEAKPGQLELLAAVHPLLVRRALMAIGATKATASRWLTSREQEVLDLLVVGKSVRVIADELGRSPHTVHDHVKSLHRKLSASSRGELVARALGHSPLARVESKPDWGRPEVAEIRTTAAATRLQPKSEESEHAPLPIEAYRSKMGRD